MKLIKLIAALAFLPVFANAQQILKLNLPKDTKYEMTTVTKLTSVATVMGQDMESGTDMTITESIKVKDTRVAETDLIRTATKIISNISAMGQDMSYDSDKKDNSGQTAEVFDKMIGKQKNITVDSYGKILKQDKDEEEVATTALMGAAGSDGLGFISSGFIGREMKPGTTWFDSTKTVGDKMTTVTTGNYTVTALNNGIVTIAFAGTSKLDGTMEQMGMEMGMTSTSKVTSQFEVDIATGIIKKSTQTTDGTMNIEAGGMSIPATTKSTVTMTAKQL